MVRIVVGRFFLPMTDPARIDMNEIAFGIIAYTTCAQREGCFVEIGEAHILEPYVDGFAKHMLALGCDAGRAAVQPAICLWRTVTRYQCKMGAFVCAGRCLEVDERVEEARIHPDRLARPPVTHEVIKLGDAIPAEASAGKIADIDMLRIMQVAKGEPSFRNGCP